MNTRKLLNLFFTASVFLAALSGCKKSDGSEINPPVDHQPLPKPVGEPDGTALSFTIGAGGGQFSSPDGFIKVTVPAGAVSENTLFQLQPVKNTCDAGLGKGYSLLPHGRQFAKPVTIRFSYEKLLDSIASEEVLSIAFQDAQGIWQMVRPVTIDPNSKTVTVTTSHFSNWTLVTWLKLVPTSSVVGQNEALPLQVLNYHPYADDLLAPLNNADVTSLPLGKGVPVLASLVKKWSLTGVGTLSGNGSKATYKAPATVTEQAEATAVAQIVSEQHQLLLLAHIRILADGVVYRIGGGEWQHLPGGASYLDETQSGVAGVSEVFNLSIIWPGGTGNFSWVHENQTHNTAINLSNLGAGYIHTSWYLGANDEVLDSGGSLKIEKWGAVGEWITGSFSVSPSGKFSVSSGKQLGTQNIEGYFRVKRIV